METTCNGGYCNYKTFGGANCGCSYEGYCDYQAPKDSRGWNIPTKLNDDFCMCQGQTNSGGRCQNCGKKKF